MIQWKCAYVTLFSHSLLLNIILFFRRYFCLPWIVPYSAISCVKISLCQLTRWIKTFNDPSFFKRCNKKSIVLWEKWEKANEYICVRVLFFFLPSVVSCCIAILLLLHALGHSSENTHKSCGNHCLCAIIQTMKAI